MIGSPSMGCRRRHPGSGRRTLRCRQLALSNGELNQRSEYAVVRDICGENRRGGTLSSGQHARPVEGRAESCPPRPLAPGAFKQPASVFAQEGGVRKAADRMAWGKLDRVLDRGGKRDLALTARRQPIFGPSLSPRHWLSLGKTSMPASLLPRCRSSWRGGSVKTPRLRGGDIPRPRLRQGPAQQGSMRAQVRQQLRMALDGSLVANAAMRRQMHAAHEPVRS